jgi:hypothetical protein
MSLTMHTCSALLATVAATAALAAPAPNASAAKPPLTPSVNRLDCGDEAVGLLKDCGSITFTNTSSGSVQVGPWGIDETGAVDFNVSNTTCIAVSYLAPGESCVTNVTFKPVTTGRRSAKLIQHAGLATSTTVRLVGYGTA